MLPRTPGANRARMRAKLWVRKPQGDRTERGTDMTTRAVENITARTGRPAGETLEAIKRMSPQNRLLTTEEVATLAVLLASEAGRGINGQAINVDGGSVLF